MKAPPSGPPALGVFFSAVTAEIGSSCVQSQQRETIARGNRSQTPGKDAS
ncbi:MAG TPA: hypothetical protein VGD88_02150 [Opitutaceae bacterium]